MATRRERVVLSLEDNFTPGMAKAAAATALLNRELNTLSGQSLATARSSNVFVRDLNRIGNEARGADRSINQLTGRLRLFADAAAIFGPGTVPVGGVLAAGVAGFASQLGFAAIAGGVLVGSMQGLGDALSALNDAHLEPTTENLAKAEDALGNLSPAAADFAREAYGMLPALRAIRDMGAEGLFPGLTESLDDLERLAPVVGNIFARVGEALGEIAADGAASLASDRWAGFFEFIANEAPTALSQMASALGSVTHGLAEMWMAFEPLNSDFNGWLADAAAGFDRWATGLSNTQGFRDFVDYVQTTGPQVADTFGALANAVVQIVQAAAPLGGPVLRAIEGFANALATVADSNAGAALIAAAAGFAAISRAMTIFNAAKGSAMVGMMSDLAKNGEQAGRGARAMGAGLGALLAIPAIDGVQRQFEGLSTGINALSRDLIGGSLPSEFDNLAESLTRLSDPNIAQGLQDNIYETLPFLGSDSRVDEATAQFEALDEALVNIATTQGPAQASAALEELANSMGLSAGQTKQLLELLPGYRDAIVQVADASQAAARDTSMYDALQAETRALEENIAAMQAKRDQALRGFSAETSYAAALMDSKKSIEENGRAWNLTTEAGLNNRRALEQQASAWNQLNRETDQSPAAFRRARNSLIETAEQMGASKREARQYADQLLDIPSDLKTRIGLDVDTAMQKAKAIKSELASIDRNIDIYVNIRRPNAGGFGPQAVSTQAVGDVKNAHEPEIAAGGAWRVWAEPETGGESYIPHANDFRRPRAKKILEQTAGMFGGQVQWFATGGTTGKRKSAFESGETDAQRERRERREAQRAEREQIREADRADREAAEAARREHESRKFLAAIEGQERAAQGLINAAEEQKRSAESVRDGWAQAMQRAGAAATSGFSSDLFGPQRRGLWSGAGGGSTGSSWMDALTGDIQGLTERSGLIAQLQAQGITGSALEALMGGSNSDISALVASGQAGQFAAMFAQREALQASVSGQAGRAAYGAQFDASSAAVAAVDARIQFLEAQLAAISAQRPITVYEAISADATAREVARQQAMQGAA